MMEELTVMADSSIVTLTVPGTVLAPGACLAGSVAVDSSPARSTVTLARPGLTVCPIVTLEQGVLIVAGQSG